MNKLQPYPVRHYINGEWLNGHGQSFASTNPANGNVIGQAREATQKEIKEAVEASKKAFGKWAATPFAQRVELIKNFSEHVKSKQTELALLIAEETGKPLWESTTEVNSVISKVNLSIQAYYERTGDKESLRENTISHLRFKPHGTVAVLGPYNFPAHLSNGHIVPALLAGNTIVYKPSEFTPIVADFIVKCWEAAGLPEGVLNLVHGTADAAKMLLNESIQGVYFTGSYNTGVSINKQFCNRPEVILALEMGGNNPLVIDRVKNQKAALYQTLLSGFITAGQRCTCARRLLISDDQYGNDFLDQFIELTKNMQIGPYTQKPEPFMGPVISFSHAQSHLSEQQNLINCGGEPLLSMRLLYEQTGFLSPGIIDMTHATDVPDNEIFAPLMQVHRYRDFEHALSIANNTQYGLVAGIFTDSKERYQTFYESIHSGLINWNNATTGASSALPFGGIGHSGNHRPSAFFAADYCAYPVASLEQPEPSLPSSLVPGVALL